MTKRGEKNSRYFFEVVFDEISSKKLFYIGVGRKADDFDKDEHYVKDHVF